MTHLGLILLLLVFFVYLSERYRYRPERFWEDARRVGRFLKGVARVLWETGVWGMYLQIISLVLVALTLPERAQPLFMGGGLMAFLVLAPFGKFLLFRSPYSPFWRIPATVLYMVLLSLVWMTTVGWVYPGDLSLLIYLPVGALFATGVYLIGAPGWEAFYRFVEAW